MCSPTSWAPFHPVLCSRAVCRASGGEGVRADADAPGGLDVPGADDDSLAALDKLQKQLNSQAKAKARLQKVASDLESQPDSEERRARLFQVRKELRQINRVLRAFGPEWTVWDAINAQLPPTEYPRPLSSACTDSPFAVEPASVGELRGLDEKVNAWLPTVTPTLQRVLAPEWVQPSLDTKDPRPVCYKADVCTFLETTVLTVVRSVCDALDVPLIIIDRVENEYVLRREPGGPPVFVIGAEHSYALPFDTNLTEYNNWRGSRQPSKQNPCIFERTGPEKVLEQTNGHMARYGLELGALCTDRALWVLQRAPSATSPGFDVLVSPPIKGSATDPTIVATLCYLAVRALEEKQQQQAASGVAAPTQSPQPGRRAGPATLGTPVVHGLPHLLEWPQAAVTLTGANDLPLGGDLGRGLTGHVVASTYKGRPTAVKLPARGTAQDPADIELGLKREAEVYQRLRHMQGQYVPIMYAHGTFINHAHSAEFPFVAMELVEGGVPLDQAASTPGFTPEALKAAAAHALAGLSAIHEQGIEHGDIRCANCLVTADPPRALWIDFAHADLNPAPLTLEEEMAEAHGLVWTHLLLQHSQGEEEDPLS